MWSTRLCDEVQFCSGGASGSRCLSQSAELFRARRKLMSLLKMKMDADPRKMPLCQQRQASGPFEACDDTS